MKKLLLIASAIALALTITSCNSDDGEDVPTTPSQSLTYAKAMKIYDESGDKSVEVKVSSDSEELLNNYRGHHLGTHYLFM